MLYPRVTSLNKNDKVYPTNSLTSSNLFHRASSLNYKPLTVCDADFISSSSNIPNSRASNNRSSLYTSHKKLYGISNSVSSHEIDNTCTVTIENNNNQSIHSEFPNSHINKIHMIKPKTSVGTPLGYTCVPNEKFGVRPQPLGLYQSNPLLHDQKSPTSNINQFHYSQHSTSLSPDISRENNFKNKLYFKKRHRTFDNNQKNTSKEVSLAPQNITNTSNIDFKSDNFKTHSPCVQLPHLKKSGPRNSSRDNSKEQSYVKLTSDKQTHPLIHNILTSGHESLKNGATFNQYKNMVHSSADSSNIPSQTRSFSTPSKTLPSNDSNKTKQGMFQKYHDSQISNSHTGLRTTHETIKQDNSIAQTLFKEKVVQNTVSPSITLQRTERLNSSSVFVASGKDTPTRLTNQFPSNASGNKNTPKSCEYTYSKDTVNSAEQILTNELGVSNQLQDLFSQSIHKQKTKHKNNLPNSNSAASSLSVGEDRTFCDSGISSSSHSKDSACTSPSDPNVYSSPMPSIGINEWVSKCTLPCVKESLHEPNSHHKRNQELSTSTSRIPSISKSLDKFVRTNFAEIVDIQQNLSITQRSQRPKTIGRLLPQSGKEVISINPNNNDRESQSTSLKCCQGVNSLKKGPHSIQHLYDNHSSTPYSAQVFSSTLISKRPTKTDSILLNNEVMRNEKINLNATNDNNTSITETHVITPNKTNTYAYPCNNYKGLHPCNHIKSEPKLTEKDDIGCNQLRQIHIINEMGVQHNNNQHLKLSEDQPLKTSLSQSSLVSEGDKSKIKRDNGKSTILYNELSSKTTYDQLSRLINTGEINNHLKPSNADEVISKPQKLSEESDGVQKKVSTSNLVESNVSTCASETGLLPKSLPSEAVENLYDKPADFTNDPDLLLSSLSKLTCDPCLEDNSWDRNYFSDVESEYAALGLILPIPKRESLTETETALELDKRLSADKQQSMANHLSDALVNLANPVTSLANNMIYQGNCLEPGYFSDTEAIFSSHRKFKPLLDPSTFSMYTTNNCKLPIAPVAPIMSRQQVHFRSNVKDKQNCLLTSQNQNTGKRELSSLSECPTKVDRMIQIREIKWPRLCSLQNLVHSSNKDQLRHVSNQQEETNKNSPPIANNTVGSGPLSQVKLPYPTVSIMTNMGSLNDISMKSGISSYEGHRKDIHNTCSDSFRYKASGKLLTGDLNGVNQVVNTSSMRSANLVVRLSF
ncbi:hypothetical protein MN116_008806 [Schistosoma mekongi]|uniref:Uncharacterized protein n=1 Tax=Schistosoma mekongi TaxID=38744 RepID=A0AAE1Z4Y2_SCHME|nr:hypothetical protein MN116_008806 [Schistosoma mekongi]